MGKRVCLIVLDSFGVGALPDAAAYGDTGANTLKSIGSRIKGFSLPNQTAWVWTGCRPIWSRGHRLWTLIQKGTEKAAWSTLR